MQVTYPSHHRWMRDISDGTEIGFSGRIIKMISSSIPLLSQNNIVSTIEPLTDSFFEDFTPAYLANIGNKANALVNDVYATTLGKTDSKVPYFGFSLRENGKYIGGTIFSLRSDRISYAYRTFLKDWNEAKLKANPALIGEHMIATFAYGQGKTLISHGKDRNPYGRNSAIGMAGFKLSVGCRPSNVTDSTYEIHTLDTDTLTEDCLILEQPKEGTSITKAYLITTKETEHKYLQVTKYPDQLTVEVLYRD